METFGFILLVVFLTFVVANGGLFLISLWFKGLEKATRRAKSSTLKESVLALSVGSVYALAAAGVAGILGFTWHALELGEPSNSDVISQTLRIVAVAALVGFGCGALTSVVFGAGGIWARRHNRARRQ